MGDADLAAWCVERHLRLILVSGAFDPLHVGHMEHLRQVRGMGDMIVVALATDRVVRAGRGEGRPIFDFPRRASMLLSFTEVHRIFRNDQANSVEAIRLFRPAVYVKGPDYEHKTEDSSLDAERIAGEECGGLLVFTVPTIETHSRAFLNG